MNKKVLFAGFVVLLVFGLIGEFFSTNPGELNPYLASSAVLLTLWLAHE